MTRPSETDYPIAIGSRRYAVDLSDETVCGCIEHDGHDWRVVPVSRVATEDTEEAIRRAWEREDGDIGPEDRDAPIEMLAEMAEARRRRASAWADEREVA